MALMPVRTKLRKMQKGQMAGFSKAANFLDFGEFGMQALERGWITNKQIEAARVAILALERLSQVAHLDGRRVAVKT